MALMSPENGVALMPIESPMFIFRKGCIVMLTRNLLPRLNRQPVSQLARLLRTLRSVGRTTSTVHEPEPIYLDALEDRVLLSSVGWSPGCEVIQDDADMYASVASLTPSGQDENDRVEIPADLNAVLQSLIAPDASFTGGENWGSAFYATDIAFGDIDGDGKDEVGVTRKASINARFFILDDADTGYASLHTGGSTWGSAFYATSIAFGDVDGDGRDEVGITRNASINGRFFILEDKLSNFSSLHTGGSTWGSPFYATSIAFGDVDGDGRDEVGVARNASINGRFFILEDEFSGFNTIHSGGSTWGSSFYATSIAFGDVDGDGRDEVGVARNASINGRFFILEDKLSSFSSLHTGGSTWGSSFYATSIAFGDVDGDGRDEVGVARNASINGRFFILEDEFSGFSTIHSGGSTWGSSFYATDIAFGDVDGDGRDEVGVARNASINGRFFVFDDESDSFTNLLAGGENWGSAFYATAVAFGDTDGDGIDELGVARNASINARYFVVDGIVDFATLATGGENWGSAFYATDIAFGDIDGDGKDEVGVTRKASINARFFILDDADTGYASLHTGGSTWGSAFYATSIAFGDVDGDGRDEVGITRNASINGRFFILEDKLSNFSSLHTGGSTWGSPFYATSIAFGDVDGDGRDEVGVARNASINGRFFILEDEFSGFNTIHSGGSTWGSSFYATSIAFGDVDGDGRDEVGVARNASINGRFFILEDKLSSFSSLHTGGSTWGSSFYATSIAFGDVDGDGRDEVGVARNASINGRFFILEDEFSGFSTIHSGGSTWGSSFYATDIAFGDVDGDGRDEVGVARNASINGRFFVFDDESDSFTNLLAGGENWGSAFYATAVAFGDTDGDGIDELGVARNASINARYFVLGLL